MRTSSTRRRRTRRMTVALATAATLAVPVALASPVVAADEPLVSSAVEAGIFVEKVDGLSEDFLRGVDVSTVLSLEESGVVFRDETGAEADLFTVLAEHGVNSVRVRVWNDPYHPVTGQGYGGGTVDVPRAVEIGERATAVGMSVLVDFHYSDFWADPGRQLSPKAWAGLSHAETATALHDFTANALQQFEDAGVDVAMVQVGNETNNAIAGYTRAGRDIDAPFAELVDAGAAAVRDILPDALVAVHFTNPESPGRYATYAAGLDAYEVDYDVFASSYYPYWHGSTDNLTSVLSEIATTYDKQVIVAETSWAFTLDDGDGWSNVIGSGNITPDYPASVQGQATQLRDVIAAVAAVGDAGIGVYYWEPAWLPVPGDDKSALWEQFGSGWATSAASDYDPTHVGEWYGGSAWDNQALFDWDGIPHESLRTFQYVYTGAETPREVVAVEEVSLSVTAGDDIALPAEVTVSYNDGTDERHAVTWSSAVDWIRGPGGYTIPGATGSGLAVSAAVEVQAPNLIVNGGFESADMSAWALTPPAAREQGPGNAADGDYAVTFWNGTVYTTSATQTVTGLDAGRYVLEAQTMGTNSPATDERTLSATTSEGAWSAALQMTTWPAFHTAQLADVLVGEDGVAEVRADFSLTGGAWGVLDEVRLYDAAWLGAGHDKSGLTASLAAAAAVDRALYTDASLAALDEAVAIGGVVEAGSLADVKDIRKATKAVDKALKHLRPVDKHAGR